MCRFAVIHNKKRANSNTAVQKPEWLAKMRPTGGYKELSNEKHLPEKRYLLQFCRISRDRDSIGHLVSQRNPRSY